MRYPGLTTAQTLFSLFSSYFIVGKDQDPALVLCVSCLHSGISFALKVFHGSKCIFGWRKIKITIYKCSFWLRPKSNTLFHSGSQAVGHVLGLASQIPTPRIFGAVWVLPMPPRRAGSGSDAALGSPITHQFLLPFAFLRLFPVCC